jgi:pteridine reductase
MAEKDAQPLKTAATKEGWLAKDGGYEEKRPASEGGPYKGLKKQNARRKPLAWGSRLQARVAVPRGRSAGLEGMCYGFGENLKEKDGMTQDSLQGKIALVTGAGKRLGHAVALRLAEEGADVVVHYRSSQAEANATVAEIEKLGRRSVAIRADLSSVSEIKRLFDEAVKHFGRLDILINSAANFLPGSIISTTEQVWDSSLDSNVKAPFFCAQAAAPLLRRTKGTIINFADGGGILGWPGYTPHSISKAGVIMLTRVLAKALAPEVRVNAIAPGTITMPGDPPGWEADFIKLAPLRRTGAPSDITDAVLFLVHSTFITGQTLVVDGGRSLL